MTTNSTLADRLEEMADLEPSVLYESDRSDLRAAAKALRQASERLEPVAWRRLLRDLLDAARLMPREPPAVETSEWNHWQRMDGAIAEAERLLAAPRPEGDTGVPVGQLGDSGSATSAKYPPPATLTSEELEAVERVRDWLDYRNGKQITRERVTVIGELRTSDLRILLRLAQRGQSPSGEEG